MLITGGLNDGFGLKWVMRRPRPALGARARTLEGSVRLGLRAHMAQFSFPVGVNALVGGMIGEERTVLPCWPTGPSTNYVAGRLSDRIGRKPLPVAGWLVGVPVPLMLIWGPTGGWVIAANVLLAINQGLT